MVLLVLLVLLGLLGLLGLPGLPGLPGLLSRVSVISDFFEIHASTGRIHAVILAAISPVKPKTPDSCHLGLSA